ncbi:MAG: hypothetical protein M0Z96_02035 [Actinomycetota bacterium]|nr:hypothetical protein [Actinomycetota bacterium]
MTYSIEDFDAVLSRAHPVALSTPASTLRQWRVELVRASVFISYAIGVLSLDIEILHQCIVSTSENVLQSLVDDLPGILAAGWVGGGWSLSPDASVSVGAAAELAADQADSLLELHREMVTIDLSDPALVGDLLSRIEQQRESLTLKRARLEDRIKQIQHIIRQQYAVGDASIDDWLD